MSARIDIINNALILLGADMITSVEDDSPQAQVMKSQYYNARDGVLEDANWTFATRQWKPSASTDAPVFSWSYAYPIPSDILRVTEVIKSVYTTGFVINSPYPEGAKSPHCIMGRDILSNDNPIYCTGIRRMEDEGDFSSLFAEAFSAKLAYLTASSITESNQKQDFCMRLYIELIGRAKTRDGMQNTTRRMRNNTLRYSR